VRIEYDPGRSGHIALIRARDAVDVDLEEGARLAEGLEDGEVGLEMEEEMDDVGGYLAEPGSNDVPALTRKESRDRSAGTQSKTPMRKEGKAAAPYTMPGKLSKNTPKAVYGGWSYILAPDGLRAGDVVSSYRMGVPDGTVEGWVNALPSTSEEADPLSEPVTVSSRALGLLRSHTLRPGNVLPLYLIPPGTIVHNLSLKATGKMALCRSAGTSAQVVAHHSPSGQALGGTEVLNMRGGHGPDGRLEKGYGDVLLKLKSGEVRKVPPGAVATIGSVSKWVGWSTIAEYVARSISRKYLVKQDERDG
jgi:ribosomal protein L2